MNDISDQNLSEKIKRQKQLVAECYLLEAWEAGLEGGIEPDLLARTFLTKTLDQLAQLRGYDAATQLAGEIHEMEATAEFLSARSLQ